MTMLEVLEDAAGLLSVLIFPIIALTLLRRGEAISTPAQEQT